MKIKEQLDEIQENQNIINYNLSLSLALFVYAMVRIFLFAPAIGFYIIYVLTEDLVYFIFLFIMLIIILIFEIYDKLKERKNETNN